MIKAAVVGLGQIGIMLDQDKSRNQIWTHCAGITNHENLLLDSVVDEDISRKRMLKILNQKEHIKFFTNVDQMINESSPEFVSVCTPSTSHLKIIETLTNCPSVNYIFCEKPMGASSIEAKKIISLCKAKNIILATNYMRRWDKRYIELRELIVNNSLGSLLAVNANGATALYTSSSHLIDLLIYLAGPVNEVSGTLQNSYIRKVHGVEDPGANIFLKFQNGATGHLKASSIDPIHYMFEIDLLFEEGRIEIKKDGEEIIVSNFVFRNSASGGDYMSLEDKVIKPELNERMLDAISDIISCRQSNRIPRSNGNNALDVHKLIQAVMESSNMEGVFKKIEH